MLVTPHAQAAPFLSVDFNTNNSPTPVSPTQGGFRGFTVQYANVAGPFSNNYAGLSLLGTSAGTATVRITGGSISTGGITSTGQLNSRDIPVTNNASNPFQYADLYRDAVQTNGNLALYLQIQGLIPNADYSATFYAYKEGSENTTGTTITDITTAQSTASGTIVTPQGSPVPKPEFSGNTSQYIYATTLNVTASQNGELLFRNVSGYTANDQGTLNGFELSVTPEPASAALVVGVGLLLGRRRVRRRATSRS